MKYFTENYPKIQLRRLQEAIGFIPNFLFKSDPRSAAKQFNDRYAHGGGWRPLEGFELNRETFSITYPGDPSHFPIAELSFRDERIFIYPHAWVMILQPNGDYEISRMD